MLQGSTCRAMTVSRRGNLLLIIALMYPKLLSSASTLLLAIALRGDPCLCPPSIFMWCIIAIVIYCTRRCPIMLLLGFWGRFYNHYMLQGSETAPWRRHLFVPAHNILVLSQWTCHPSLYALSPLSIPCSKGIDIFSRLHLVIVKPL